jgi:hypothetical protein
LPSALSAIDAPAIQQEATGDNIKGIRLMTFQR